MPVEDEDNPVGNVQAEPEDTAEDSKERDEETGEPSDREANEGKED